MIKVEKESFKYYAFISYSHNNKKIAQKLQKNLESYNLPSALQKSHPDLPKKLFPVFIDEDRLVASGGLDESIRANLDDSNYLIVICSPDSAKSSYVNDEIAYFIKIGRRDHIIPIIIDGEPKAKNASKECFPRKLRTLSRGKELLGIDIRIFGIRDSFLRVIATLLRLDLDHFINFENRRRKKKFAVFGSIASIFAILAGIFIWHGIPHQHYYRSYVYKFGEPVGLFEVKSESERQKMEYTYRFTTLRSKVQKIERVNYAGVLVDPTIITPFTELPMINFTSDRNIEYCDINGNKIYRKEYTKNFEAADFYLGDDDLPYAIQSDTSDYIINQFDSDSEFESDIQDSGNIIRLTLEHDDNGYLVRKMFRLNNYGGYDKKGIPVFDEKGRGGISYTIDDMGRVIEVHYTDIYRELIDVSGVYSEHIEYGDSPYPVKVTYKDESGNLVLNSQGIAIISINYDENVNPHTTKVACFRIS
ncbi:MAG: toll/interleukin-1 receptor domain-containing protein [Synergistaceae bacterium]|nr:toll/interleukin-1 receptor domain-containing protein [Synergistaceae bacterium]